MKTHQIVMTNREVVEMYENDQGDFLCPVCGDPVGAMPWDWNGGGSFEICSCCDTEFGYDDAVSGNAPIGSHANMWEELRRKWVEEKKPDAATLEKLRNIGLSPANYGGNK